MTKKPAAEKAVSAVKAPRAVRPSATPRVTKVRHTKSTVVAAEVAEGTSVQPEVPQENKQEAIAKIAYGYWEARGFQGGDSVEDWTRAEAEYLAANVAA